MHACVFLRRPAPHVYWSGACHEAPFAGLGPRRPRGAVLHVWHSGLGRPSQSTAAAFVAAGRLPRSFVTLVSMNLLDAAADVSFTARLGLDVCLTNT